MGPSTATDGNEDRGTRNSGPSASASYSISARQKKRRRYCTSIERQCPDEGPRRYSAIRVLEVMRMFRTRARCGPRPMKLRTNAFNGLSPARRVIGETEYANLQHRDEIYAKKIALACHGPEVNVKADCESETE